MQKNLVNRNFGKGMRWLMPSMLLLIASIVSADFIIMDGNSLMRYTNDGTQVWKIGNGRSVAGLTLNEAGTLVFSTRQGTDQMLTTFGVDGTYFNDIFINGIHSLDTEWLANDLNGDGRVELAYSTRSDIYILSVDDTDITNVTYTQLAKYTVADDDGANGTGGKLILGDDYNGDGVRDIIASKGGNTSGNRINIWDPTNGEKIATYTAEECRGISHMIFGPDQNGDGIRDLWVCNPYRNNIQAYDIAKGGANIGIVGFGDFTLRFPNDICEDDNGMIYISTRFATSLSQGDLDSNFGNVVKYDPSTSTTELILDTANVNYQAICYIPDTGYAPSPFVGQKVGVSWSELSWTNPDPNDPATGVITCDVYFSETYPEYGVFDPNGVEFMDYNPQVLATDQPISSIAMPAIDPLKEYFWRVDVRDSSNPEAGTQVGKVWKFITVDNLFPVVDAGADVQTWMGAVVTMAPTITDDGQPDPPAAYTVLWEKAPEDVNVIISDPGSETTTVSIDAVGTYTLTLTADDSALTTSDTVTITVYADACEHAQAQAGYTPLVGDLDNDCDIDMFDAAMLAANWLASNASE